ncbi:hypothetical protein GCM10009761_25290 [Agromyces terreus]
MTLAAAAAATALLLTGVAPAQAADGADGWAPSIDGARSAAPQVAAKAAAAWTPTVERIGGVDRYDTAVKIAKKFPANVERVFVVTGADFPDALGASAAAGYYESPVLLTTRTSLPAAVVTEIKRLNPEEIVLVGGTGVVSTTVENSLKKLAPVVRLAGTDRYDTNRKTNSYVFEKNENPAGLGFIATGAGYADALSAGGVAGAYWSPVVLVNGSKSSLDAATKKNISDIGVQTVVIVGGSGAVSSGIEKQFDSIFPGRVYRESGDDRYSTSAVLNDSAYGTSYSTAFLAAGTGFADALAGGALAAVADGDGGPLFLVQPNCVPAPVLEQLKAAQPDKIVLLGGSGVLSSNVAKLKACAS